MYTTENNKLIAEFMGKKELITESQFLAMEHKTHNPTIIESLKYDNDWNWLMEVVEKIENITDKNNFVLYDFTIYSDAVIISDQQENPLILINKSEGIGSLQNKAILFETKIEAVYNACVEFIKQYNSAKKDEHNNNN